MENLENQPTRGKDSRRRNQPRGPRFEMRISTKYAPQKPNGDKPLTCTSETTLKPEQLLELYRYLKLTRLVEERLVNLYRQTKIVGGVFRSLGQEATAVGSAYALQPQDFLTPLIRDLGAVLVKEFVRARSSRSIWRRRGDLPADAILIFTSAIWRRASLVQSRISAT